MAWARQHDIDELHLIVERDEGELARRAALFVDPPTVWRLHGTELQPPQPKPFAFAGQDADPAVSTLLVDAGLDVVIEYDRLAGEWRGLEVARVVDNQLQVGVGEADRELTAMVHGELSPEDALRRVVDIVQDKRWPGAPRHPLNQLVPERWLRWTIRNEPGRVGLDRIEAAPLPRPRRGMRERDIAAATADGAVVVCSVGIDLDLVPAAADARLATDRDAHLVLVVPERDDHPVTRALADRLHAPAEIRTVAGDWRL
jgi:hypothetical protein